MSGDTASQKKRNYKFLEMLPAYGDHAMRVRVQHHVLAREVEFRILAEGSTSSVKRIFFLELKELTELDHPAFLPVLERGMIRGCHCYTVPLRFHPSLDDLLEEEKAFQLEDRCQALRNLASGLCAAHLRGLVLGPMAPGYLAWDAVAGGAYFLHHQVTRAARPTLPRDRLPADVGHDGGTTATADVYHWGLLATQLLTSGETWLPGKRSLRERLPNLDRRFAATLEACLEENPENRPRDGAELNTVLHVDLRRMLKERGPEEGGARPPGALEGGESGRLTSAVVTESLRRLRETGRIPTVPVAPTPDPESVPDVSLPEELAQQLEEGVDAPEDPAPELVTDDEELEDTEQADHGELPPAAPGPAGPTPLPSGRLQVVNVPPRPPRRSEPRPASEPGAAASPFETRGRRPALLEGLAAGFLLGFAAGGWAIYLLAPSHQAPPPAGTSRPVVGTPRPPVDRGRDPEIDPEASTRPVSELPPSTQAHFKEDRFVQKLLDQGTMNDTDFEEVWKTVRFLSLRKRLPASLDDRRRIIAMRDAFEINPEEGVRRLEAFLGDLRTLLGRR